jgi:hypothetical protein
MILKKGDTVKFNGRFSARINDKSEVHFVRGGVPAIWSAAQELGVTVVPYANTDPEGVALVNGKKPLHPVKLKSKVRAFSTAEEAAKYAKRYKGKVLEVEYVDAS